MAENPSTSLDEPLDGSVGGMDAIGPHVERALADLEPPATDGAQDLGEPPALDQHASEPLRCNGITKAGERCKGTVGLVAGMCSIHRGLLEPGSGAAARAQRNAEAAAAQAAATARDRMTLRDALAARAADERDRIVDAMFAPLVGEAVIGDDGILVLPVAPMDRQKAALAILERMLGKPGEAVEQPVEQPLTWEQEVALLVAQVEAQDGLAPTEPLTDPS